MGKLEDKILDILAEIIARFIIGFGAVWGLMWLAIDAYFDIPIPEYRYGSIALGIMAGVFYAIFGTRKGPGAI